jgi:hypothetical protein
MDLINKISPTPSRWAEYESEEAEDTRDEQEFPVESLYSSWGRGKEFQARFREAISRLVVSINDEKTNYEERIDGVFRLYRGNALKDPPPFPIGYNQTVAFFSRSAKDFISEVSKLGRRGAQMMLFSENVTSELVGYFQSSLFDDETLFKRFRGILQDPQRFKGGIKISSACVQAVEEFFSKVGVFVMYAEMEIKEIHRDLLRFKIEFDRANPDVVAMMKKTMR